MPSAAALGPSSQHHGVLLPPLMPAITMPLVCTGCCHVWRAACSAMKLQVAGYAQAHSMSSASTPDSEAASSGLVFVNKVSVAEGGRPDQAHVMVMCDRRELLVDLMRHPGRLYPIRADSRTEFPDLGLPMQSVEGEGPCLSCQAQAAQPVTAAWHLSAALAW